MEGEDMEGFGPQAPCSDLSAVPCGGTALGVVLAWGPCVEKGNICSKYQMAVQAFAWSKM